MTRTELKQYIKDNKLRLEDVAYRARISLSTLTRYLSGETKKLHMGTRDMLDRLIKGELK
jgi:transcriptional regulator with XRE-family HTH domain